MYPSGHFPGPSPHHGQSRVKRVAELLELYPELNDAQIFEVLYFLRRGPALEIGLLREHEQLGPIIEAVQNDHAQLHVLGIAEAVAIIVALAAIVGSAALLWSWA